MLKKTLPKRVVFCLQNANRIGENNNPRLILPRALPEREHKMVCNKPCCQNATKMRGFVGHGVVHKGAYLNLPIQLG